MKLHEISLKRADGVVRLVGDIESESGKRDATYFAFPEEYETFVSLTGDPFAVAMLAPAMAAGESLTIVPEISRQLLLGLHRVRDLMLAWFPEFHPIDIDAVSREPSPSRPAGRAATFFSGGIDSFYTLLKYRRQESLPAPLTHIIFMRGIETRLELVEAFDDSRRLSEEIAQREGVECIVGETNIRTTCRLHWEKRYFGSGLAATALALAGGFDFVCVPSDYSYHDIRPNGSSPLIEERFSTEHLQLLVDGAEVSRAEKTGRILGWDRELVLKYLRVCTLNMGGAYNCGECYKCVRTAIALAISGINPEATNFRNRSTDHWERSARDDRQRFIRENQQYAHRMNADPKLVAMLDRLVRRDSQREAARTLVHGTPLARLMPLANRIRERFH
jgi:hypothetical protein